MLLFCSVIMWLLLGCIGVCWDSYREDERITVQRLVTMAPLGLCLLIALFLSEAIDYSTCVSYWCEIGQDKTFCKYIKHVMSGV